MADPVSLAVAGSVGVITALPELIGIFSELGGDADKPVVARLQQILGEASGLDRVAAEEAERTRRELAALNAGRGPAAPHPAAPPQPPVAGVAPSTPEPAPAPGPLAGGPPDPPA